MTSAEPIAASQAAELREYARACLERGFKALADSARRRAFLLETRGATEKEKQT